MHFRANVASGIFSGYRADDGRAVVRLDGVLLEGFLALWVGSSPCFDWGCKGPNSAQTALALLDWSGIPERPGPAACRTVRGRCIGPDPFGRAVGD